MLHVMIRLTVGCAFSVVFLVNSGIAAAQPPDPFRLDPTALANSAEQDTNTSNQNPTNSGDTNTAANQAADASTGDTDASPAGGTQGTEPDNADSPSNVRSLPDLGPVEDLSDVQKWGVALLTTYGIPAIIALVILIAAYFLAAFLARLGSAPVRKKVDETLGRFIAKLIFYLIMVGAFLGVLQSFGIGVASFAAVLAAMGFAVGLAFQGTLSNFAAGIMLLVFRPFKVGDVINAAGITAKVFEIDLFATKFDTFDNRRIIVPNSAISNNTIENVSHHRERRIEVVVGVDYAASLVKTREVLTAAAQSLEEVTIPGDGRGFQIMVAELANSAITWNVRLWTLSSDVGPVKERLIEAVKNHLDGAGIGIPFPQMEVHLRQEK